MSGQKMLLFPETRPTLVFIPDPKNFMDFILVPKLFGFSFHRGLVCR